MRLIDANEVLKSCVDEKGNYLGHDAAVVGEAVSAAPTVDAVPVVRCKDCELWNEWDSAGKESLGNYVCSCAHWSVEDGAVLYTRPTDYCSYGERKGGDE